MERKTVFLVGNSFAEDRPKGSISTLLEDSGLVQVLDKRQLVRNRNRVDLLVIGRDVEDSELPMTRHDREIDLRQLENLPQFEDLIEVVKR